MAYARVVCGSWASLPLCYTVSHPISTRDTHCEGSYTHTQRSHADDPAPHHTTHFTHTQFLKYFLNLKVNKSCSLNCNLVAQPNKGQEEMLGAVAKFVLLVHLRDVCTVCRCAMIAMFVTNPQEGCNLGSVVGGAAHLVHVTCRKVHSTLSGTAHTYLGGALGMVPYCCKFGG